MYVPISVTYVMIDYAIKIIEVTTVTMLQDTNPISSDNGSQLMFLLCVNVQKLCIVPRSFSPTERRKIPAMTKYLYCIDVSENI
jgi:hypothetical protein